MVEKEDGEEYYVNFNVLKNKFTCTCVWNVQMDRPCKHLRYVKEFIINGKTEYES
jgi:hypothetical protein